MVGGGHGKRPVRSASKAVASSTTRASQTHRNGEGVDVVERHGQASHSVSNESDNADEPAEEGQANAEGVELVDPAIDQQAQGSAADRDCTPHNRPMRRGRGRCTGVRPLRTDGATRDARRQGH